MTRDLRIYCFVTDAFGGHGGIAVYNKDLLTAFTQHPRVAHVTALPRLIPHPMEPLPDRLIYRTAAARGKLGYLLTLIRDLPAIARADVLYCAHLNLGPLVRRLGRLFGKPVLCALYGIEAWDANLPPARKAAASQMDHYYSISAYTQDRFQAWAPVDDARITILPNAVHLQDYGLAEKSTEMAARYGLTGRTVLMTFGRLVSRERAKGFDEVLDVLPDLLRDTPDLAYIIAGDGPDRDRLEARVRDEGLSDHVVFTGFVDEAEKAALYSIADLYVMPSRGEGFGFVFLESLACGVPVVASSVDGSRDAVRDGQLGPMVDPDDPEALKTAIATGLRTPRGIPEGLSYFDFPRFVDRVRDIVDGMVRR